jgi:anhydro-N-acetylmuramic acid kinase
VLNLGGVGNVTWIGADGALLAFDTGPGNALIDDWALRHTGRPVDEDGRMAAAGRADPAAERRFLDHPYFGRTPPKSLDRDDFGAVATALVAGLAPADGAATLTALTAAAVAAAAAHFPRPARRWLVCGGGRRNPQVMAALRARLDAPVDAVEAVGWDGDAVEAQAFAYLAVRTWRGLPITYPETTGIDRPLGGGRIHRAGTTQLGMAY